MKCQWCGKEFPTRKGRFCGTCQDPRKTTRQGYVAQFQWAPPDEPHWIDCGIMHDTQEQAKAYMAVAEADFNRRKARPECVRTGIRATRVVRRTIIDEVVT